MRGAFQHHALVDVCNGRVELRLLALSQPVKLCKASGTEHMQTGSMTRRVWAQVGSDFVAFWLWKGMFRLAFLLCCASAKLLIQKPAPDFVLDAAMPDDSTKTIALSDYKNKQPRWHVEFSLQRAV